MKGIWKKDTLGVPAFRWRPVGAFWEEANERIRAAFMPDEKSWREIKVWGYWWISREERIAKNMLQLKVVRSWKKELMVPIKGIRRRWYATERETMAINGTWVREREIVKENVKKRQRCKMRVCRAPYSEIFGWWILPLCVHTFITRLSATLRSVLHPRMVCVCWSSCFAINVWVSQSTSTRMYNIDTYVQT